MQTGQPPLEVLASSSYSRFHIETKKAPPLYREPPRYDPQVKKIQLALLLIHEFNNYVLGEVYKPANWKKALSRDFIQQLSDGTFYGKLRSRWKAFLDRPCIYGVFSGRLGGFKPKKEKCTACMRCKQEYPHVIKDILWGKEFLGLNYFGWKPEEVYTLWYEAREGKELVKGMGYRGRFATPGWDSIWLDMSEIVRPTRDGKKGREYISTAVDIGRKPPAFEFPDEVGSTRSRTIRLEVPILFDSLPDSSVNDGIRLAIAEAARRSGTVSITSPQSYVKLGRSYSPHLAPLVSPRELEMSRDFLFDARIIEFEDADYRDLADLRRLFPSSILIARIRAEKGVEEQALRLARDGADAIHVSAKCNGLEYEEKNPRHVKEVIRGVHGRLVREGIRDEITIIASGGIFMAEHVAKAILCGCDAVAIDSTIQVALQSKFEAASPTEYRVLPRRIDFEWGAQRLTNVMAAWHEQFIEALSAMGKRDGRRLRGDVGRGIFYEDMVEEAFGDIDVRVTSSH